MTHFPREIFNVCVCELSISFLVHVQNAKDDRNRMADNSVIINVNFFVINSARTLAHFFFVNYTYS